MERSKSIMISIILLASLVASTTNSSADGEDIIVESNMTWSGEMTLSQNVRILNGGSLSFVDSKVNISSGVGIYVDASSSLSLRVPNYPQLTPLLGWLDSVTAMKTTDHR